MPDMINTEGGRKFSLPILGCDNIIYSTWSCPSCPLKVFIPYSIRSYTNPVMQSTCWIILQFHLERHRGEERFIELRYSAKRWVVERTNSWYNRFRKLLVRYEKKSGNYVSLVYIAAVLLSTGGQFWDRLLNDNWRETGGK